MLKQQSVLVGDIDGILVGIEKQKVCWIFIKKKKSSFPRHKPNFPKKA